MKLIKKSLSVFLSVLWNKYKKMPFFEKLLSAGPRSGGPASSSPANTFSRLLPVWLWITAFSSSTILIVNCPCVYAYHEQF